MQVRFSALALSLIFVGSTFLSSTSAWSIPQFGPEQNYSTSSYRFAFVDLDRDGDSDLVLSSFNSLHWRENLGGGEFGDYATLGQSTGSFMSGVYAHDVNGDGFKDVLVYGHTAGTLSIYLNTGGTPLNLSITLPTEVNAIYSLSTPDLNGDGDPDLLLNYVDRPPTWHAHLGAGIFGAGQALFTPGTGALRHPHAADVDGDGIDEWVVWKNSSSGRELRSYEYTPGSLASTFSVIRTVNLRSNDFLLEDFDGDGDPDIVFIGGAQDRFVCLLNDGAGNFGEPIVSGYDFDDSFAIVSGDADGDGDLDVLLGLPSFSGVVFLENLGSGRFSLPRRISQGATNIRAIDVRDLNEDGRPDVVHKSSAGVNLQFGGPISAIQEFGVPVVVAAPQPKALSVAALDVNGDGRVDFVTTARDRTALRVYEDAGDGTYSLTLVEGLYPDWHPIELKAFDHGDDGDLDLLATCEVNDPGGPRYGVAVIDVAPGTGLQPVDGFITFQEIVDVAIADIDGDGLDEVVAAGISGMIYRARVGYLASTVHLFDTGSTNVEKILLADVNAHPGADLFLHFEGGTTVRVFTFVNGIFQSAINSVSSGSSFERILDFHIADADLDGDLDVLLQRRESRDLLLRTNSGTGAFGLYQVILEDVDPSDKFEFADVAGTEVPDLVRSHDWTNPVVLLYEGQLSGSGQYSLSPPANLAASKNGGYRAYLSDADQDGDLDIINSGPTSGDDFGWVENRNEGQLGSRYCVLPAETSSGTSASLNAVGSTEAARNELTLKATGLPLQSTAMFITSLTPGFASQPGGSAGDICLAGIGGRFSLPGQVLSSGALGEVELALDLTAFPQAGATVSVLPGDTWYLQTWFRDVSSAGTSNFSEALEIRFR